MHEPEEQGLEIIGRFLEDDGVSTSVDEAKPMTAVEPLGAMTSAWITVKLGLSGTVLPYLLK